MLYNFEWDIEKEKQNNRKHKISFVRATSIFRDPNQISIFDEEHSDNEERWITSGFDKNGVLLVVIHTFKQTELDVDIRIISARKANQTEIKQYEEFNQ
ncbi:MAG: BrnT family toxin [Candidatus Poribacteria bacterium]|nr:BrnT family toxin [Candidatus Poribacteria bacterium]